MHQTAPAKLREIFGADTALYITVTKFGTTYTVLNSETLWTIRALALKVCLLAESGLRAFGKQ